MDSVQPPQGAKEAKTILPKGQMTIGNLQIALHYSGSPIGIERSRCSQVAFSSRKSHTARCRKHHRNWRTAVAAEPANGFDSAVIEAASMLGRGRVRRLLPYHPLCDPAPFGGDANVARRVARAGRFAVHLARKGWSQVCGASPEPPDCAFCRCVSCQVL